MQRESKASWEGWFKRNAARPRPIHIYWNVLEMATRNLGDLRGKRILEVGCGRGATLLEFSKRGACAVGLDYARGALTIGKDLQRQLSGNPAHLVQADALKLPFPANTFDLTYSVGVMEHFHVPGRYLAEQNRVLKPGGSLIVQVPQKYTFYTVVKSALIKLSRWPYGGWETQYSEGELANLLKTGGFFPEISYGYGSFVLMVLRHFFFHSLSFECNSSLWKRGRLLAWLRSHTAVDVGIVARKVRREEAYLGTG